MNQNIIRHKIICIIAERRIDNIEELTPKGITQIPITIDAYKEAIPISTIADKLGISERKLKTVCIPLIINKEICYINTNKGKGCYIGENGLLAYTNETYKNASKKMRNDAIYDITKWLIPSLLLVMTLSTVWINCTSSNEKKDTWKAINNLQLEVDTLKSAKQIQDLSKTILDSISSKHWK